MRLSKRLRSKPDKDAIALAAERSRFLVESQLEVYRTRQSHTSTIIGVISLFIPFFINNLRDADFCIKFLMLVPLAFFVVSLFIFVQVILYGSPVNRGLSFSKFPELVNSDHVAALLMEIGGNKTAFDANQKKLDRFNERYNVAVGLATVGILMSILLLYIGNFMPNIF